MTPDRIRIASRGSRLARWQSDLVAESLRLAHPRLTVEVEIVRTTGDKILDVPLAKIGDRGLFTKEIDEALMEGRADLAVHSLKDIPTRIPEALELAAVSEREDPRDVLISPVDRPASLESLPRGACIGTSSLRRRSQLKHHRPDLDVADLRGNLDTRLRKLDEGEFDAIILAAAGVLRLGWSKRISEFLPLDLWLPAVGQGALGIVCRGNDATTRDLLAPLNDSDSATRVAAERAFLRALEGGCQVPIGASARLVDDLLEIDGFVSDLDGVRMLRARRSGDSDDPEAIGSALAADLISRGATEILQEVRAASTAPGIPGP